MCGYVGFYSPKLSAESAEGVLRRATQLLHHRGPDSFNVFIDQMTNAQVGLGHARLRILDISSLGDQPMHHQHLSIAYNGEIYNFKALRKKLESEGHRFKSHSDTEVILKAFDSYGPQCFQEFNGMWSLCILDRSKNRLFLSRDRLGIKPLYYYFDGESLYFASEIKAILEFPGIRRVLEPQAVADYLSYRAPLGEKTFFKNIYSLRPGHHLIFENGHLKVEKYWELNDFALAPKFQLSGEEIEKRIQELFEEAVKLRMVSDVPIASFLSGGLDSSIITGLMAKNSQEQVNTFSIGFNEENFDELPFSQEVATMWKTNHTSFSIGVDAYFENIRSMILFRDAPLSVPNEIPLYLLSKRIKPHASVALAGEGADELFGGYSRIFWYALQLQDQEIVPVDAFINRYTYLPFEEKQQLLQVTFCKNLVFSGREFFAGEFDKLSNLPVINQFMTIFQKHHLLDLLHRLDSPSMTASVEARVPFVDHKLIEFVLQVPTELKIQLARPDQEEFQSSKLILRQAFKEVIPDRIRTRKKVGFPVPLGEWLNRLENKHLLQSLLDGNGAINSILKSEVVENWIQNDSQGKGLSLWMLINLDIWQKEYNVEIA
jgi:asparagine synthase (glutamine-hydrolysing)